MSEQVALMPTMSSPVQRRGFRKHAAGEQRLTAVRIIVGDVGKTLMSGVDGTQAGQKSVAVEGVGLRFSTGSA
jgi:hypothetical protein